MKKIECPSCGSNDLVEKDGFRICNYCGSKFRLSFSEKTSNTGGISLNDDIARLLDKCQKEPWNAKKYANLILDIDPTNKEARKYL